MRIEELCSLVLLENEIVRYVFREAQNEIAGQAGGTDRKRHVLEVLTEVSVVEDEFEKT